ncbi:MAG: PorT family protein [Sphingobacteriales bacterium]|jgi:hypothetical protein|nr:MAG: PorT family protein [Sphingobacteriales bacterium]
MKKIHILLAFALVSGSVMAQSSKGGGIKYGIRGGVNLAQVSLTGKDATKEKKDGISTVTSFYFGANVEIPVSETFSIQPGLGIGGKGTKINFNTMVTVPFLGPTSASYVRKTDIMYLEMPINAVAKIKNFYLGAGPYIAYGIAGKDKIEVTGSLLGIKSNLVPPKDGNVTFGKNAGEVNPFDYGVNFLAGYQLDNGFNLGVNYGLGLGKSVLESGYDAKASNRVFSVLVGFSF